MALPLFYKVPLRSQGFLLVFHFKVFSQRAKKTVVCQVLWLLLLHQAVISVIREHKRDCYGCNVLSQSESSAGAGRKKSDRHAHQSQKQFACFPLIFPPSFLLLIFKQAACILSQVRVQVTAFEFPVLLTHQDQGEQIGNSAYPVPAVAPSVWWLHQSAFSSRSPEQEFFHKGGGSLLCTDAFRVSAFHPVEEMTAVVFFQDFALHVFLHLT